MSSKKGTRALTRRQPTARSQSVVTHVDAIHTYNNRLQTILDNEKVKDGLMRTLEGQLYADKLKHAELVADVSYGHELMEIEERCDNEYTALEEEHTAAASSLREAVGAYEEAAVRVSLADVDGVMLQAQLQQAVAREKTLASMAESMKAKLESLKATEKATNAKTTEAAKRSEEVRAKHSEEFDRRPSNLEERKGSAEIKALVGEAQRLRAEHAKIMKKLNAAEAHDIKVYEEETTAKLAAEEEKLRAQFSREELKRITKHDSFQRELKLEMDRLEEKMKGEMEAEEKAMRDKIKKLSQKQQKAQLACETMRQQVVDALADRKVHKTQMQHFDKLRTERGKAVDKLRREETALQQELAAISKATKASQEKRTKVAAKYALVVTQNKKMAGEIQMFNSLVSKGEAELDFAPANKRIRLHSKLS